MKRLLICLLVFSSLSNLCLSKPAAVSQDVIFAKELKSLSGTWRPISTENNGYNASEANLKGTYWIREANGNWSMRRDDKIIVRWAIRRIDASKQPKTIDIEIADGSYKSIVYLGIYDVNGDTSRICFALPDRPVRPTEFSAAQGSIRACSTFKRDNN